MYFNDLTHDCNCGRVWCLGMPLMRQRSACRLPLSWLTSSMPRWLNCAEMESCPGSAPIPKLRYVVKVYLQFGASFLSSYKCRWKLSLFNSFLCSVLFFLPPLQFVHLWLVGNWLSPYLWLYWIIQTVFADLSVVWMLSSCFDTLLKGNLNTVYK